jgi:hypothetical protein
MLWAFVGSAATFLFDATKAEMAGNADWVVDADLHDLRVSAAIYGSGVTNAAGVESNPQRFPTPPASGITSVTTEDYWQGALSAWAVDLVKGGHQIETLPYNGRITWNDGTNPQDLSHYQVFVLCEPNIYLTNSEKAAIINFVQNGGGLFIIADHSVADRNNDGSDAYQVLNDLMTNSVQNNPFGIRFNGDNVSISTTSSPDTDPADPITLGPAGTVVNCTYHNGSTITINTNQNPSARIAVWSSATHGTNNGMIAYATFGGGKVVAIGDSSLFDDGTGDPGDTLFVDYPLTTTSDGTAIRNASFWLVQVLPVAPTPETVTNTVSGGNLILSWGQGNWTGILSGTNVTQLTTTNLGVTSPYTNAINLSAPQTYYRLFYLAP